MGDPVGVGTPGTDVEKQVEESVVVDHTGTLNLRELLAIPLDARRDGEELSWSITRLGQTVV